MIKDTKSTFIFAHFCQNKKIKKKTHTGSTNPLRVISPVIAVSDLTNCPLNKDTKTVAMVTPADGPSLPTAPAGKWMCISFPANRLLPFPKVSCNIHL